LPNPHSRRVRGANKKRRNCKICAAGEGVYHPCCAAGYDAAILAEVAGPQGSAIVAEVLPELAARAKENLAGYPNVDVLAGDGAALDPGECDAMRSARAARTRCHAARPARARGPPALPITIAATPSIGQGPRVKITRRAEGFATDIVTLVGVNSCTGARTPELELPLKKALAAGRLFKMKLLPRDALSKLLSVARRVVASAHPSLAKRK
jgi:protein-L-isoaspartate(D-aspartate) O-methyltransferase